MQLDLIDDRGRVLVNLERVEQAANLERVSGRISAAILGFCRGRSVFHMEELRRHVEEVVGDVAPGSPDRILRLLRKQGRIDYEVLSRARSMYRLTRVA